MTAVEPAPDLVEPAPCDGAESATSRSLRHHAEQLHQAFKVVATFDDWRRLSAELASLYGELADRVGIDAPHGCSIQSPGFGPWCQQAADALQAYYEATSAKTKALARIRAPQVVVTAEMGPGGSWQASGPGGSAWSCRRFEDIIEAIRRCYPEAIIRARAPAASALDDVLAEGAAELVDGDEKTKAALRAAYRT